MPVHYRSTQGKWQVGETVLFGGFVRIGVEPHLQVGKRRGVTQVSRKTRKDTGPFYASQPIENNQNGSLAQLRRQGNGGSENNGTEWPQVG